jgi:hypothetical protein
MTKRSDEIKARIAEIHDRIPPTRNDVARFPFIPDKIQQSEVIDINGIDADALMSEYVDALCGRTRGPKRVQVIPVNGVDMSWVRGDLYFTTLFLVALLPLYAYLLEMGAPDMADGASKIKKCASAWSCMPEPRVAILDPAQHAAESIDVARHVLESPVAWCEFIDELLRMSMTVFRCSNRPLILFPVRNVSVVMGSLPDITRTMSHPRLVYLNVTDR